MVLVTNANNNWELNETANSQEYSRTLKASGTFVNRNIEIKVTAKSGSATTPETTITAQPEISATTTNGKFKISVSNTTNIIPVVNEGWVSTGTGGLVSVTGSIDIDETKITSGLVSDAGSAAGSSNYRVTASTGYNPKDLISDIPVYQGIYNS